MEEEHFSILILVGTTHSGKTTYAKECLRHNKRLVRVNRDELRDMMSSGVYDKLTEEIIKQIQFDIIERTLNGGHEVIVDNTHLSRKDILEYMARFSGKASIGVLFFDDSKSMERAIDTGRIADTVVVRQMLNYKEIFPKENFPRGMIHGSYHSVFNF